jgi:SAM-dependent methyltransferase
MDRFWNELGPVIDHLARLSTGSESDWWTRYIKRHYCTPPRRRGLVIACGNGWVERALIDEGIVEEVDAFDADPAYVALARDEQGDRRINYFVSDFRSFHATQRYDLVVNYAALHHATWLYRHCNELSRAMEPDGIFVNWDYIGADRNQYDDRHLDQLRRYNLSMPERFRTNQELRPSLRLALQADPTEAVHASEIVRALRNEFEIIERHDLGGGFAYPLLWNNIAEFERDDQEARRVLADLLRADAEAVRTGIVPNLFTFIIAKRRSGRRSPWAMIDLHLREPAREWAAARIGNVYLHEAMSTFRRHRLWHPFSLKRYLHERRSQTP